MEVVLISDVRKCSNAWFQEPNIYEGYIVTATVRYSTESKRSINIRKLPTAAKNVELDFFSYKKYQST